MIVETPVYMQEVISVAGGVLDPQGPIAAGNAQILINSVGIMLVIVIPTIAATLAFGWWFRSSNKKATYLPNWAHSGHLELIVWGIPLLVVLFLSGVIWIGSHELDPAQPIAEGGKPIEIQVVSLDWKWLFIYPDQELASVNELAVPANTPVHFSLTSGTVMNMFFVPQLGSMIATMNGMVTQLNLKADHIGDYYGQSSQFSGSGFSDMHFTLRALTLEGYTDWLDRVKQTGQKLDEASYLALARRKAASSVQSYVLLTRDLFEKITMRELTAEGNDPQNPKPNSPKTE